MLCGGPREVEGSQCVQDKYLQKAKKPPQTMVHIIGSKPPMGYIPQPDDIIFTHTNESWVHHPHEEAVVITIEVANSLVHRLLVDSGRAVKILYQDAYQKAGLR